MISNVTPGTNVGRLGLQNNIESLYDAIENGKYSHVKELLESGVNPNVKKNFQGAGSLTPLHKAICSNNFDIVKLLFEFRADERVLDDDGGTFLHWAAKFANTEIINLFLEKGVNVDAADRYGRTALIEVVEASKYEVVTYLLSKGASINYSTNICGYEGSGSYLFSAQKVITCVSPLFKAVTRGDCKMVKLLLNNSADPNVVELKNSRKTVLQEAVNKGDIESVKALIEHGVDVDQYHSYDSVCKKEIDDLRNDLKENYQEVTALRLQALIRDNKYFNDRTITMTKDNLSFEFPPLIIAIVKRNLDMAHLLVNAGANTNVSFNKEIHCDKIRGNISILHFVLEERNKYLNHESTSKTAKKYLDLAIELIKAGAKFDAADSTGVKPLHIVLNSFQNDDEQLQLARLLLENEESVDSMDDKGETFLFKALKGKHFDVAELLLKKGADLSKVGTVDGCSPLYLAVKSSRHVLVCSILNRDVDLNKGNQNTGETPLQLAREIGNQAIIDLLEDANALND